MSDTSETNNPRPPDAVKELMRSLRHDKADDWPCEPWECLFSGGHVWARQLDEPPLCVMCGKRLSLTRKVEK